MEKNCTFKFTNEIFAKQDTEVKEEKRNKSVAISVGFNFVHFFLFGKD